MKYCKDRTLRQQLYMAYNTQCTHDNEYNNMDIIKQLVNIRMVKLYNSSVIPIMQNMY